MLHVQKLFLSMFLMYRALPLWKLTSLFLKQNTQVYKKANLVDMILEFGIVIQEEILPV